MVLPPAAARGRRGPLLVHGFVCNRGLWNPWLERLHARGIPFVAVDLEPVFGSIDDYVRILENAVQRLERCTGLAPVIVAPWPIFRVWTMARSTRSRLS